MENLRLLRKNANLTQRELAEKVNIPKTNIGHYEIGITRPSIENLIKLADFFGCSIDYLLGHQIDNQKINQEQQEVISLIKQLNSEQIKGLKVYISGMLNLPSHKLE